MADLEQLEGYLKVATPAAFARTASEGAWKLYPHLRLLDKALVRAATGQIQGLIIEMPPRHGKSELISKYFPAWYLGTWPEREVLLCSYQADFAATWGRKARDLMDRWGPELWGVEVNQASRAAHRWTMEGRGGGMNTAGAGGAITGKGAHLAIIDDPVKNEEEALSANIREKLQEWYKATFSTRLYKGGCTVVVQTRWHDDDLAGWLWRQVQGSGRWERVTLPGLAYYPEEIREEELAAFWPDPLGRQPGEPLCPDLLPAADLAERRARMGEFWFWALYQQRPIPATGGLFKREWFLEMEPAHWLVAYDVGQDCWGYRDASQRYDDLIQSWDCSFRATAGSSYVVGQVWGRRGADRFLLDQVRARMDLPDTIRAVQELSRRWPGTRAKLIEGKANGPEVIRTLQSQIPGLLQVIPEGQKHERAAAQTWLAEAGNIYLPPASRFAWVGDFLAEAAAFPRGAHDDQVDAFVQAQAYWERHGGGVVAQPAGRATDWSRMYGPGGWSGPGGATSGGTDWSQMYGPRGR